MKVILQGTKSELEFIKNTASKFVLDGFTKLDMHEEKSSAKKIIEHEEKESRFHAHAVTLNYLMFNASVDALGKLKRKRKVVPA